jgi:hypothetical protein
MFLTLLKLLNHNKVLSQNEVTFLIKQQESLFQLCAKTGEGKNTETLSLVHSLQKMNLRLSPRYVCRGAVNEGKNLLKMHLIS